MDSVTGEMVADSVRIALAETIRGASSVAWPALRALVTRTFGSDSTTVAELDLAEEQPTESLNPYLVDVLVTRTRADEEFRVALLQWVESMSQNNPNGSVTNNVVSGTVKGQVVQAEQIGSITFGSDPLKG